MNEDRKKALDKALKDIKKSFGKGSIMRLGEKINKKKLKNKNATKIQLSQLTLITAKCLVYLMKYVQSWNNIVRFPLVKQAEFQALLLQQFQLFW